MRKRQQQKQTLDDSVLIPLLARRSYHLPGNGAMADYSQWFRNNHILFGICLHHPLHPLETWERLLLLLASVSFGLVATSVVYELYASQPDTMNVVLLQISEHSLTTGMVLLWTAGGLCHTVFDMVVWHVMACACCHPGGRFGNSTTSVKFKDCGSYALIPVVLGLLGLAAYFVLLEASTTDDATVTTDDDAQQQELENVDFNNIQGLQSFHFLFKYGVELLLAWFVYFPVVGTILFSGLLGCRGTLPILGGRPRDVRLIAREQQQKEGNQYRML